MSVRVNKSVLVSGWIMLTGFAFFNAPALSAVAGLSLFIVGVVVIPALALIPGAVRLRAVAGTRRQFLRGWRRTAAWRVGPAISSSPPAAQRRSGEAGRKGPPR